MSQKQNLNRFLERHISELRQGGWSAFFRKSYNFLLLIVLVPLAIPVLLVVRALRPLVHIRFGRLLSTRIGHFATNTELYVCERDVYLKDKKIVDILYHIHPICNKQLKKMWDRTLHIHRIARFLYTANRLLPGYASHEVQILEYKDYDGLFARTKPHVFFTPEEEQRGIDALKALGVPEDIPFVCFHSRDPAYLKAAFPHRNWHYQDFRDSSIHSTVPAVEELANRGYYMVRMGAVVEEALETNHQKIIDYAKKDRTDFLDIFLCAKCRFFLGSANGLAEVPIIFRRPIAWVNYISLGDAHTWYPNSLFIPKKLWLQKERRFLTFPEVLKLKIAEFQHNEQFEQSGVKPIENTPEEIAALAVEMDERLKGAWQTTEEDEELQLRFWSIFKSYQPKNKVFLMRIGTEFLRQNRELLVEGN